MPDPMDLIHELDIKHASFEARATQILDDHTIEIGLLRGKMDGIWLKIFLSIGGIVGAAVTIGRLV